MAASQIPKPEVDIIVPVYNAKKYAQRCLDSVLARSSEIDFRLIVVNDGSDDETAVMLQKTTEQSGVCVLLEHEKNLGYTRAVNTGLKHSTAPFSILLNSDTEVTNGWLTGLLRCFASDDNLGIVGPLSNAASWQSVPRLLDDSGHFYINSLPTDLGVNQLAERIREVSRQHYPEVPFVNGFCFMVSRAVVDTIGYMDEAAFPLGYGEENDYCLRASKAGFKLAIADDVYVHHAKSKSFGHEQRKKLSQDGSKSLKKKYGTEYFNDQAKKMRDILPLNSLREHLTKNLEQSKLPKLLDRKSLKVLFILPKPAIGGGSHSVVQEVNAMRSLNIEARVAVEQRHLKMLHDRYKEIPDVEQLFLGYVDETLLDKASQYDVAIATIFHSTNIVKNITDTFPHILPAYYIQDYEPLFFDEPNELFHDAVASYNRLENGLLFAKTYWIAREVERKHGVAVEKVVPSIDHAVYYPEPNSSNLPSDKIVHIATMIRPRTPRRGAERTMDLMASLKARFGDGVVIHLFGCDEDELQLKPIKRSFDYVQYGILQRTGVADLLRKSDIFVDLSDYQAFGRTSLEAMACGATAMLPIHGGGDEYAIDGKNAIVVDSFDAPDCEKRMIEVINSPELLNRLKTEALSTSQNFSPEKAANSELDLIQSTLSMHRQKFPLPDKRPCLYILRDQKANTPHTFQESKIANSLWQVAQIEQLTDLDDAEAGILLTRGILSAADYELLSTWNASWQKAGGAWLHEIANPRYLKKPNVKGALKIADDAIVFSMEDALIAKKFAANAPIVISSEYEYLAQIRESLFQKRARFLTKLAQTKKKPVTSTEADLKVLAQDRKKRLWQKFRNEPRRYFADSHIKGLRYLKYLFPN